MCFVAFVVSFDGAARANVFLISDAVEIACSIVAGAYDLGKVVIKIGVAIFAMTSVFGSYAVWAAGRVALAAIVLTKVFCLRVERLGKAVFVDFQVVYLLIVA